MSTDVAQTAVTSVTPRRKTRTDGPTLTEQRRQATEWVRETRTAWTAAKEAANPLKKALSDTERKIETTTQQLAVYEEAASKVKETKAAIRELKKQQREQLVTATAATKAESAAELAWKTAREKLDSLGTKNTG